MGGHCPWWTLACRPYWRWFDQPEKPLNAVISAISIGFPDGKRGSREPFVGRFFSQAPNAREGPLTDWPRRGLTPRWEFDRSLGEFPGKRGKRGELPSHWRMACARLPRRTASGPAFWSGWKVPRFQHDEILCPSLPAPSVSLRIPISIHPLP